MPNPHAVPVVAVVDEELDDEELDEDELVEIVVVPFPPQATSVRLELNKSTWRYLARRGDATACFIKTDKMCVFMQDP